MDSELPLDSRRTVGNDHALTESSVTGQVSHQVFCSDDGNYAVIRVEDPKTKLEMILVGAIGSLSEGQDVEAWGSWEKHKTYGRQFRVSHFEVLMPSTLEGMRRYLASGIIQGVGPKLADRIVDHFGEDTMKILEHYSARLTEVPGFGKSRLKQFRETWASEKEKRDVFIFLQGLGISAAYCERIYKKYGAAAVEKVQENPYRLARDIHGIGFQLADKAAERLDIGKEHVFRLASGVQYVLDQLCQREGHSCCPREPLLMQAAEVLRVEVALAEQGLQRASEDGALVISADGLPSGEELIYPAPLFYAERELAERVRRLCQFPPEDLTRDQELPVSDGWSFLNEAQQRAVLTTFREGISIITGGPGVGKTTVTREIVHVARKLGLKVALGAPTGRAAKRLSEATGCQAKTLHRLLRWAPDKQGFTHGPDSPLPEDLLIVDEVSMVDLRLATSVVRALAPGTRLVLVGDRDQLPSVGPGAVLRDLLTSRLVSATHLTEVYRQEADSRIVLVAHDVNQGRLPHLGNPRQGELQDFYWIEQEDPDRLVDVIRRLVSERIPERFNLSPMEDIQVLSPMNRGPVGAVKLNQVLQEELNVNRGGRPQLTWGETHYREHDRVMQVSNNYETGVFNGDMGHVQSVDPHGPSMNVVFDSGTVTYEPEDLHQLRLAYAITIHKSQGSEFPAVIVPLLMQHYVMLQRRLIYTAITRPSRLLIMTGSRKALEMAVGNVNQNPRFSRLSDRLQA